MPAKSDRKTYRHFVSADQGCEYPVFDITGQLQRARDLQQSLNRLNETLAPRLTRDISKLLSHDNLQVICNDWEYNAASDREFWLSAFTPDQPHQLVLLGLDRSALFGLSELFFGGRPEKLTEKQLSTRIMADTERRLCNRLLNLLLNGICPHLNFSVSDWQSSWLETGAAIPANLLWCPIKISTGRWSATVECGWPAGRNLPEELAQDSAKEFAAQLEHKLQRVSTKVKVEVAALSLTLQDLGELKAGDILPLDLGREAKAWAGELECLRGLICEHEDRLALRITNVVGDER
jgi:flagellar motor switch protein FliM